MKIIRKIKALRYNAPFRKRVWYNLRAMLPLKELIGHSFVEIFDEDDNYISCPGIGGTVVYNINGRKFLYRVVGFQNESRNRDWLYDTDYINPVIEFIKPL